MNRKRKLPDSGSEDDASESSAPLDKSAKLDEAEPFCVLKFIASLESEENAINELQKFIDAAELFASGGTTNDVALQFLTHTAGNLHSVANLIREQKSVTFAVAQVYRCLELLLHRVAEESPHLSTNIVSSVEHALLQSRHHLQQSLSRSRSKRNHVRAALRMLTALAVLGSEGARLVTQVVNFNTPHFSILLHWRSTKEREDVRTCAVYLLLSIMTTARNNVVRQILEIKDLMNTIFSGLVYDRAPFICNFLRTLRAKVVRNMAFAKTTKICLFNERSLQYVLRLLNWMGPRELKIYEGGQIFCRGPPEDDDEETRAVLQVSQEDMESVHTAALEFLQDVCCSHKTGIIFRDTSLGLTKNMNPTITRVLQRGRKLYESAHGQEFLVQVMHTCPEQITHYLQTWTSVLSNASPHTTEKMVGVLQQIVGMQDIAICLHNMREKSPTEMCEAVITLSLLDFVSCITEAQCMQEANKPGLGLHLTHMGLLRASLDKICSALDLVRSNSFAPLAKPEAREKFELALTSAVWQNVPPASDLVSRYLAVATRAETARQISSSITEEQNPLIHVRGKYCLAILEVLELYWVVFSYRSNAHCGEEYINWELLWQMSQTNTEALQRDVSESLQLRALQLVINAAPTIESLFTQSEKSVFRHLLTFLTQDTDETTEKRASSLVMQILCKISVLEPYCDEMNIWIEKFCLAQRGQHTALGKLFTTAVQLLLHDPNMYNDEVMQYITESNADKGHNSVDLWGVLRGNTECRALELDISECGRYFSPLLPAILESLQARAEPVCKQYVDAMVVEILHIQQQPHALCMFLENSASQLTSSIQRYVEVLCEVGLKHTTKDCALLEPNAFYAPLVPKLGNIFIRHIIAANKKGKRKSMSVDMDDIMSAVRDADPSRRTSLFRQILFYVKTLFDHEQLLFLLPEYLGVLKAVLEPSLDMSVMRDEGSLHLLNLLLRHETTLTWYLNVGALDTAYQSPSLEYTQLILDAVLHAHQKWTSTALATISDPLSQLKDKTVRSISSGGPAFCNLWSNIVRAFATMFGEHDKVVLLEVMLALPGDDPLHATQMLVSELSAQSPKQQQAYASLSSAAINKVVALKLKLDDDDGSMEKDGFGNAVLQIFISNPNYCAALEPDCIEQLASSISSLDVLSFIMEHSPAHRCLFHGMISHQEIRLHPKASPQGIAALLSVLAKTLPLQQVEPTVSAWVVKQFLRLPKWLNVIEEQIPHSVAQLIADTVTSLLSLKLLGKKDIQKLLDMVSDAANHFLQLVLLNRISEKATPDFKESLLDSLVQHFLTSLCKAAQDEEPAQCILEELERSVIVLTQFNDKGLVRVACRDNLWQQSIVSLLKSAFKSFSMGAVVFKLISAACERVYMDTSVTAHPSAANIYMMIFGHSKFLSLMLDVDVEAQEARGSLLQLMTTLVRCEKSICCMDHVPLFLSAYGATLSSVDQKILYLLYLYEESGVKMTRFRPYMWGPSAASFYSVYKKSSRSLFKQPKTEEILGLFNDRMMASSLLRFPLDLDLKPIPHEDAADNSVYDPRFVLPLLHSLLSPGSLLHCRQFVELRFFAYVLHSLCSEVFQVRSLGYNVLCLFCQHLEGSRYSNSAFWFCVLESLRNGLTVTSARLPCLLVGYLANAVPVIHNAAHDAFNPVLNFLLAKPVININNVPDFYRMFFNETDKHRFRRTWFLEVVATNLRSSLDFHICNNRYVLGILEAYFMAPICNKQSKVLVLKIFLAAVKIPKAARTLCREQGLLAWMSAALSRSSEDAVLSKLLFGIVHQVWLSSCAETLTYMDKMAVALKKEHEAISQLAPEHRMRTEVLRGHHVEDTYFQQTVPAAFSNIPAGVEKTPPKRRFYEHFPFEFLLGLWDMCKYVRNCSDLTTATQYIQDMGDAFTYIHTRKGLSAGEDIFRPTTQLIHSILQIWEHFSSHEKSENLNHLGEGIIRVCGHWLPMSAGSQDIWIRTLDMALEHSRRATSEGLLKWVSLWLKSDNFAQTIVSDCKRLNKIVDRARDVLCGGGYVSEQDETVIDVMTVLFNQAVEETLNEELKPKYQKAMRSLKKKSLTDKQKALATTVLLQELLLKKPKPHLFGMYTNTCVNAEQTV